MAVKYQVDGDIFREITEKWPFAYVSEHLIRARKYGTDQAGNQIEYFQLSDGRVFERAVTRSQVRAATSEPKTRPVFQRQVSQPVTQPR
ncbi:MAG: hypothetical protein ACOYZ8_10540 [Chloroflexota bacterium]